ncbi:MAG TPA: tRNA preQ1(34) S-adenosylmethionine ribosyltransferase-isomerase QueA [Burkholderiales bacterium]|nr:tRNA preQ1(34) S-adenosylmethionine ribosyltransferase-isomerase QueA [Burkholderiales bacterium]
MRLEDFDYALPEELIAQHPPESRGDSRLLHLDGRSGTLENAHFRDLPRFVRPNDLLVFNDTRVIKARLFGRKASGGQVEVLVERILDANHALAQVRASHAPTEGSQLLLAGDLTATVTGRNGEFFQLRFEGPAPVFEALERVGSVPLPPYITRPPDVVDEDRYQTVYAREPGAVAAPTAGLHFDPAMLKRLREAGAEAAFVTLHVGAGTFQPVRVLHVAEHQMHVEWCEVPEETVAAVDQARALGGRVMAVGTTTLRALESAARGGDIQPGRGDTNLFIVPGFRFRVVDRLLTNFHLPKSTLMMLVAAFGGLENIRRAYRHAVDSRYRFLSYGDAMLIERA